MFCVKPNGCFFNAMKTGYLLILICGLGALGIVFSMRTAFANEPVHFQTVDATASGALTPENPFVWAVQIGGTSDEAMYRDPIGGAFPWRQSFYNSVSLSIENQGETDVRSPWITTEAGPSTFSLPALLGSLLPPDASQSQKAWTIYDFVRAHVFHESEGTGDNSDPIKLINCYGQGICGDSATALSAMWAAASLEVRAGRPLGHSTSEVRLDGDFRYLDADLHAWVLKADNHTVAGEEDFVRDPYLMKRTHTYGLKLWNWDPPRDAFVSGLFWYRGDRGRPHQGPSGHTMSMTLRPQERITWLWEERFAPLPDFSPRVPGNGATRDIAGKWFHGVWEYPWTAPDSSEHIVPFHLPYPIVGFQITGLGDGTVIAVSADGKNFHSLDHKALEEGIHEKALLKALGRQPSEPPSYALFFKVSGPPARLRFRLDFQVAPLSLPVVHLGENRFNYTDSSESRKVQITYRWREDHENHPPAAPEPEDPAKGATLSGSPMVFRWVPPTDPDGDAISDYQFQLSENADPFHPLSPNFDALLSFTTDRGTSQFTLPHPGLLNGGTTYFWRVRARDAKDGWGPWGGPWPVTIAGPPTPLAREPVLDHAGKSLHLQWEGTASKYRVFGSFHRGFTPDDKPHKVLVAKGGGEPEAYQEEPSNLLAETGATEFRIPLDGSGSEILRPFYRVQAVDAHGIPGAWSGQIEVPGPILVSPNPLTLSPNQTSVVLDFLGSKGHLVNLSNDYHERLAHPDTWLINAVECSTPVRAEGTTLFLDRPLAAGERLTCRLRVRGSGYFNRERRGELELTLVGGSGDSTSAPPPSSKPAASPPPSGPLAFTETTLENPTHWKALAQNAQMKMQREPDGFYLVATPADVNKPWSASLEAALPQSAQTEVGKTLVSWGASLLLDIGMWQAGYELTLRDSANRWATVILNPWLPVQIRDSDGSRAISKEPFAPAYGKPVSLSCLTDKSNGSTRVLVDGQMLCEMPGKSPFPLSSGTLRIQLFAREPASGSLGIGNIGIETVGNGWH